MDDTSPTAVKLMCPMGDVKTIYYRKGKSWRRVGTLCLHCLWFNSDPTFGRQTNNHHLLFPAMIEE